MATKYGIELAVNLISSYFGDIVAKVCECLLRRGNLTLANIVRFTELKKSQVTNSLLVLIQHNCVQAYAMLQEGGFGDQSKVITQYLVLFDNIIHHLRFPKFLALVNQELGKECEDILEGLLQHGRLSLKQIMDRHKVSHTQSEGSRTVQEVLQEHFDTLINARYVERCPAHEPFISPPSEEELAAKKRAAKASKMVVDEETMEKRVLEAAAPMESLRFANETYAERDDQGKENQENQSSVTVGEKRKHRELDTEGENGNEKKEVLWRANCEEFIRRLRHKACIANVKKRLGEHVEIVLSAILEATGTGETKVKAESTAPLSMNNIFEEVIKNERGRSLTMDHVSASLVQLGCDVPVIALDETYRIDLKSIIDLAQSEEVESIVLKRYGREAYRIFRLLLMAGHLFETDKISDTTFVEKAATTKILLKLWKDDYLNMEKISAAGNRESHFMLWKVNKQTLWKHVLDELYHAALNVRIRIVHELDQKKEILQIPGNKLVGEMKNKYMRLKKVRILLETSLMRLDDSIMLFHDF